MSELVDCRGLSCPEPVLITRQAMQKGSSNSLKVLVSNAVARDNVARTAKSMGWKVNVEIGGDGYIIYVDQ
ncbi:MAG: sulfurtransferase TusA family protein [Clostridia bacterium]|nr:sulfurtransferase TusA family protein [Clostridia bacterium]